MMTMLLASPTSPVALLLAPTPEGSGTGLEWMPVASVLAGVALLVLILWYGSRVTV